jgi:hypothetical protein
VQLLSHRHYCQKQLLQRPPLLPQPLKPLQAQQQALHWHHASSSQQQPEQLVPRRQEEEKLMRHASLSLEQEQQQVTRGQQQPVQELWPLQQQLRQQQRHGETERQGVAL